MIKKLIILGIIALPTNIGWADCQPYWTAAYKCMEGCGPCAGGSGVVVPAGPTPEQIQKQKEQADQADLSEDTQYETDEGNKASQQGDWAAAVQHFKRALDDSPDDSNIQSKYNNALQKMNDAVRSTEAARQLQAIAHIAQPPAVLTPKTAQIGFDTSAPDAGSLKGAVVQTPTAQNSPDPVVPDSKRTPEITAIEEKRTNFRDRIKKLDETLKTIDAAKDPVQVAKLKQEKSNLDNQVHYLNFSIGQILTKPAQTAPPK